MTPFMSHSIVRRSLHTKFNRNKQHQKERDRDLYVIVRPVIVTLRHNPRSHAATLRNTKRKLKDWLRAQNKEEEEETETGRKYSIHALLGEKWSDEDDEDDDNNNTATLPRFDVFFFIIITDQQELILQY